MSLGVSLYSAVRISVILRPRGLGPPGAQSIQVVRTCVCPSVDQVKIFVSRNINGSKLIFQMRMYLYETSRILVQCDTNIDPKLCM